MTTVPAITRDIGQAERTLRALLDRRLEIAGLAFPEWTILVVLDTAGPLAIDEVVRRQLAGRVVADEEDARAAVLALRSAGLVGPDDEADSRLVITSAGEAVYRPLRETISRLTAELYGDLPEHDMEVTRRTLVEIARRANVQLADTGPEA